ncbi:HET-domain-containing protein [Zopfia rhizophila CBS 207.26]|uniref:HET-domain-containing protein n=1 Tax=Zopfia rhizophila CBS 207.26 TaxID=1314779 RepID=A0A6A6DDF4_9PEZI|nr:HET-domain-containing protein [Zopfia rhizophila CBS 207.26]
MDPVWAALYLCIFIASAALLYNHVAKRTPYRYSSLPPGNDNIRLLRLIPNEDETAAIKCQLFNYSLEPGRGTHLYEALSYVWGNPNETVPIFINEHVLLVTASLHAALLHLRDRSFERIIWVDAICINQADNEEKGYQIQSMGKIYGQATRVIVWLGKAEDDSDQALEAIRSAAEAESTNVSNNTQKAVLALLQRSWFERTWVLQEIASARRVLIMCGPAEINGYAFCSGLNRLKLSYRAYPGLQGLIRSVTYLIRGAIFRPKYGVSSAGGVSLGELIDMYHTREATIRHDKVYALLGMSSDDPSTAGLAPNYNVPWRKLLQQLVEFLLCKQVFVETWDEREIAMIKSKGCVIGQVSMVKSDSARYDRQQVNISFKNTPRSLECQRKWGAEWSLQASAKSIRQGDLVCLLQGASKPTIIRACKDHFAVIMIAVTLQRGARTGSRYVERQESLASMKSFPQASTRLHFLLVWSWEKSAVNLRDRAGYETSIEVDTVVPEYSRTASDKATRLYDVALVLEDSEEYEEARRRLQEATGGYNGTSTKEHPHKLAGMDILGLIYKRNKQWEEAKNVFLQVIQTRKRVQGHDHPDTLSSIANLASTYVDQGSLGARELDMMQDLVNRVRDNVRVTEEEVVRVAGSFGNEMLTLLLGLKRDNVHVTEKVVKAAAGNWRNGKGVMTLLLDRRGNDVQITEEAITEEVVKAAAGNRESGKGVMTLLLDRKGNNVQITEEVVKAAAGNEGNGKGVMTLLLDRRGNNVQITEEVVHAAAGNEGNGKGVITLLLDRKGNNVQITEETVVQITKSFDKEVMTLLLDRRGDDVQVTEEVVKAAAGNQENGIGVMTLLFDRGGNDVQITEEVVKEAAGNWWNGKEVMTLLLDRGGNDVQITEEVVKAATGNRGSGKGVMTLLLDRRGNDVQITKERIMESRSEDREGRDLFPEWALRPC